MSDIVRVTVEFEASESKRFRMYSGAFVRGFIYWVIRKMDRVFAEKLHSSKAMSPFSVTPVMDGSRPVDRIEEGKTYEFSINFFIPEIGEALKNYLTAIDKIYFAGCENPLKRVLVKYCDKESLFDGAVRKFRVEFVSPCYFRTPSSSYRFVPLPLPNLMFRSLARLYSAFLSEVRPEYRKWLDSDGITVSGLKIKTEKVLLKKGMWSVGFVGSVNFTLPDDTYSEEFARITSMLLNFGEYSNAGGGRTSGLGVMKVVKREVE
ncbi:CRISPR-associated endoribonuclease Cas6 [Archaeoglobus fulgidus DSM 8774]|uniref:CRISPR-associated endoribonuclease Cas6 n=1 Tax=Archaeoglobus fulgidus DSM 8774 TaxID=1344584 RepID=A0A075WIL5_ARCFL|nr:CRISPR-associated endoribonuclease Cas6 [Archaeoglobus fulgidus]AIG97433.1 CRISPR-associated endoribonuclease Cas6 [Archaeoglobus fulgidus DSM 8774]